MSVRNLEKILQPSSVAVVAAAGPFDSVGQTVLGHLLAAGYAGDLLWVDPYQRDVAGLRPHRALTDLPGPTDLAIVCNPGGGAPELVRQCGEAGIRGLLLLSAGYRDAGAAAQAREEGVRAELARFPGMRLLGPNSMGLVVPRSRLNASLSPALPQPGRVAFVSQSATLCSSVLDWALQEEIGFSHFVSIGNMLDVGVGDLIDYFATDPHTDSIILYVESITEARPFMSAARAVTQDKPIVVYKAGRFVESAEAVVSHTGLLCGVDAVYEAAFERAGIVRVSEIDDMFDCAQLLARVARPQGPRLAIEPRVGVFSMHRWPFYPGSNLDASHP